jgi:hypothetical protein
MTDRPILFSAPMVRAILREIERPGAGKTQTRRVLSNDKRMSLFNGTWSDSYVLDPGNASWRERDVRYATGDRLWVREAWRCNGWASDVATIFYRASEGDGYTAMCEQYPVVGKKPLRVTGTWRPGIHMPRWASRLTLTVTEVRVQRLQEISRDDAIAEGIVQHGRFYGLADADWDDAVLDPREAYGALRDSINADRAPWDSNPWVVAVTFTPAAGNIDQVRS